MTRRDGSPPVFLGIEAGGTRTVAQSDGGIRVRREFGPANLRLVDDRQLELHFRAISKAMPQPVSLGIGMAGARTEQDRERIRRAAALAWRGVTCFATHDLETALLAGPFAFPVPLSGYRVLVLSGTGSCCFGIHGNGKRSVKVGGWGHIIGDKGSVCEIGLRALKAVVFHFDHDGKRWPALGQRLLRTLALNEPDDLIAWAQTAGKDQVASLALDVFAAWETDDAIAGDILEGAAASLAIDAIACARALGAGRKPVQFLLAGSVLLKQPRFASKVTREIKKLWSNGVVTPLRRESVWGAVELARRESRFGQREGGIPIQLPPRPAERVPSPATPALSPTEERNPASMLLDRLPLNKAIDLMLREDAGIAGALRAERKRIEQGVKLIVKSLKNGGRLFYVGAGTSGRLGVLDASECPPTFRTDPELVQGIIAGGQRALWSAVEGAEDDRAAGARALEFRGVGRKDIVVGIAASGRTPFVWGALGEAKRRKAATMLLCFNHRLKIPRAERPTLVIAPRIGPEVLTGSTRLKAGTATKLVLNIFTTLAMVRLGKVLSNLMIDVKASNVKLRDRAVRIVREVTGAKTPEAAAALEKTDWNVKGACARLGVRRDLNMCRRNPGD
jgi:N-acetylmuramic acid 6-phosphate etherase